jgi:hypothetical protein
MRGNAGKGRKRERDSPRDNNQMQSMSGNSHLPRQSLPPVWEKAPGLEGVSELPQVS